MKLICLGSSSKGNGYLLQASDDTLMVECGTPMQSVKKALGWQIKSIVGCVVSHEHQDHAKYLPEVLQCGIRVLALPEVFRSHPTKFASFCKPIKPMQGYKVGGFKILPLMVAHDVPCVGYVIEHEEMGRLLFITDTMMLEYKLPGLNHIMLEANYSDAILQDNVKSGAVPTWQAERVMQSHMEIKTAVGIIKANDMATVSEVILVHLSERNADAEEFIKEMEKAAGRPVYVAHPGFKIELSNTPY